MAQKTAERFSNATLNTEASLQRVSDLILQYSHAVHMRAQDNCCVAVYTGGFKAIDWQVKKQPVAADAAVCRLQLRRYHAPHA